MTWLRRFFAPAVRPRPTTPRRIRPTLETLDTRVVPTVYSAGNFPANQFSQAGVFRYSSDAGRWQQLTYGLEASKVAVDGHGDVLAEFPTLGGVWRYEDGPGWTRLTAWNASDLAIAGNGNVVAEFPGHGVWRYEDATRWTLLSVFDASLVDIDGRGDVAAEFPSLGGVWRYEDSTLWKQIGPWNASSLGIANGNVVAEFHGHGVWRYEDATKWQQLGTWDATEVNIDSAGDVVASFDGHGVYRYEDATKWRQLDVFTPPTTGTLGIADGGIVVADLPGTVNQFGYGDYSGVYLYQDGFSWIKISNFYATSLGVATP